MEENVRKAIELYDKTPNGEVTDADTILADIIEEVDMHEAGLGLNILEIWLNAKNREDVENTFYCLSGVEFEEFVKMCVEKTTKRE